MQCASCQSNAQCGRTPFPNTRHGKCTCPFRAKFWYRVSLSFAICVWLVIAEPSSTVDSDSNSTVHVTVCLKRAPESLRSSHARRRDSTSSASPDLFRFASCGSRRNAELCRIFPRYVLCGSPDFFKIEEAAAKRNPKDVAEVLQSIIPGKPELADMWEATYAPFRRAKIKIHAAHLAASLGSVEVLKWLRMLVCNWPIIRMSVFCFCCFQCGCVLSG